MVLPSDVLEYRDYSYENFTTIRLKKKNQEEQVTITFRDYVSNKTKIRIQFTEKFKQTYGFDNYEYINPNASGLQLCYKLKKLSSFLETHIGKTYIGEEYKVRFKFGFLIFKIISELGDVEMTIVTKDGFGNLQTYYVGIVNSCIVSISLKRSTNRISDNTIMQIIYHKERSKKKRTLQSKLTTQKYFLKNPEVCTTIPEIIRENIATLNLKLQYLDRQPSYYIFEFDEPKKKTRKENTEDYFQMTSL